MEVVLSTAILARAPFSLGASTAVVFGASASFDTLKLQSPLIGFALRGVQLPARAEERAFGREQAIGRGLDRFRTQQPGADAVGPAPKRV